MKTITLAELEEGKQMPEDGINLEEFKLFNLGREMVWKYRCCAESFFEGVE